MNPIRSKLLPSRRSDAERNRLVEENRGLVYLTLQWAQGKYPQLGSWFPDRTKEDWEQILFLRLMRIAELYDATYLVSYSGSLPKPAAFSTYAVVSLRRAILSEVSRYIECAKCRTLHVTFSAFLTEGAGEDQRFDPPAPESPEDCFEEFEVVAKLAEEWLLPREWDMICRKMNGQTLKDIGRAYGVSKERARQLIEMGLGQLRLACRYRTQTDACVR